MGVFVGAASPVAAEVCAAAGVDWVLLDLEHGAGGEEQVGPVVVAAAAYGVPTVVRAESAARIRLGRVLDLGAAGVMLPRLDTADEVSEALRHLRYPPAGDRGVATYNRACRFGLDPGALDLANAEVLTVVQIESARAAAQVERSPLSTGWTCCSSALATSAMTSEYRGTWGHRVTWQLWTGYAMRRSGPESAVGCWSQTEDRGREACRGLDVRRRRLRLEPVGSPPSQRSSPAPVTTPRGGQS